MTQDEERIRLLNKARYLMITIGMRDQATMMCITNSLFLFEDEDFAEKMTKHIEAMDEEIFDMSAELYIELFTEEEIDRMMDFYKSPCGQKILNSGETLEKGFEKVITEVIEIAKKETLEEIKIENLNLDIEPKSILDIN
jgi:hypothetical protein